MQPWIAGAAGAIAQRAADELATLIAISSPSGDVQGADAVLAAVAGMVPDGTSIERLECSSPDHAQDMVVRLTGSGSGRVVLLGHVDTVISHSEHQPMTRVDGRLVGSGAVDMKGGVALALGVLRAFAARGADFAEIALLLVCDEEWRARDFAHTQDFAGYDACLCFEAGQLTPAGEDAVVVKRKAAGTLRVLAHGRSAHSGAAPDKGANALLALAAAAQAVAGRHAPDGEQHLTAVPTVLHSGDAFNVVPATGELLCDLRADTLEAFDEILAALRSEVDGVRVEGELLRRWPGMDACTSTRSLLRAAGERLGRPVVGAGRGGASDASYMATALPITIDGLGPRGGGAHAPHEYVLEKSILARAEVALAVLDAVLSD